MGTSDQKIYWQIGSNWTWFYRNKFLFILMWWLMRANFWIVKWFVRSVMPVLWRRTLIITNRSHAAKQTQRLQWSCTPVFITSLHYKHELYNLCVRLQYYNAELKSFISNHVTNLKSLYLGIQRGVVLLKVRVNTSTTRECLTGWDPTLP